MKYGVTSNGTTYTPAVGERVKVFLSVNKSIPANFINSAGDRCFALMDPSEDDEKVSIAMVSAGYFNVPE